MTKTIKLTITLQIPDDADESVLDGQKIVNEIQSMLDYDGQTGTVKLDTEYDE